MLNTDCFFQIGATHKVCEDFVLCGEKFALVADGCSSSMMERGIRLPMNVDTGARFLALAAKQAIPTYFVNSGLTEERKMVEDRILQNLRVVKSLYDLPSSVFDSTLLLAYFDGLNVKLFFFGDGAAVIETGDTTTIIKQEFLSGAPYYLSYQLSQDRNLAYIREFQDIPMKQTIYTITKGHASYTTESREYLSTSHQAYTVDTLLCPSTTVTLFTDGIFSFNTPDLVQTILECTAYKSKVGAYVWKRMNLTNTWMRKNGFNHYDDLGMASLHIQKD